MLILLEAHDGETAIEVQSPVLTQFGPQIRATVTEMLETFHVGNVRLLVQDRGAYDCTLRARMEAVITRYQEARS